METAAPTQFSLFFFAEKRGGTEFGSAIQDMLIVFVTVNNSYSCMSKESNCIFIFKSC